MNAPVMNLGSSPRPSPHLAAACIAIAVALLAGVAFSPSLTGGFLNRGDGIYLKQATRLQAFDRAAMREAFSAYVVPEDSAGLYQPLALLSLAADARLTTDPSAPAFQFRLTNLLLHALNAGLVFALLARFARRLSWATIGSLLFALHPAQVTTVAWISQRPMLLGMFFALLTLYVYAPHLDAPRAWRAALATFTYLAAVLAQPMFLALPVILLMLDGWPGKRHGARPIREKLPMLLAMIAAAVVQIAVQRHAPPAPGGEAAGPLFVIENLAALTTRLLWPVDLSPFYPAMQQRETWPHLARAVGVVVCLLVVPVWSFRRCPPLFLGLCGALVLTCPALLHTAYTDRLLGDDYLYAALLMPLVAVAAWLGARSASWSAAIDRLSMLAVACIACIFGAWSYAATFTWQDSVELYRDAVARFPNWPRARTGLVEAYLQEREYDAALMEARRAADLASDDPATQFYLGTTLLLHHGSRSAEAVVPLRKALRSNPNWIACLQNLGVALARSGELEKAIPFLEKARDLQPGSPGIRIGLGHAYLKVHRPASARRELQEALRHRNDPIVHLGLAMAWAANSADDLARRHLEAALAKDARLADRIAASPELRRIGANLGIQPVEGADGRYDVDLTGLELPAARSARGS